MAQSGKAKPLPNLSPKQIGGQMVAKRIWPLSGQIVRRHEIRPAKTGNN